MGKEVREETHSAQESAAFGTRYPRIKVMGEGPRGGSGGRRQGSGPVWAPPARPPARPRTHSGLRDGALCRPRDGGLSPSLPGASRLRATVSFSTSWRAEGETRTKFM